MIATLSLSGCARDKRSDRQTLDIESGEFGVPSTAKVISLDFVSFERQSNSKYSRTASLLAQDWLSRKGETLDSFLMAAVGEVSEKLAAEIEEAIRAAACIYVIEPSNATFINEVATELATPTTDVVDDVINSLPESEQDRLYRLNDGDFDREIGRIAAARNGTASEPVGKISRIAVASQCLYGIQIGDQISVFTIDDKIAIARPHSPASYVNQP